MRFQKMLSALLAVVLLVLLFPFAAIPANAANLTEEEFAAKIATLKKEYPDGKYWNDYNGEDSQGNSKAGDEKCRCTGSSCPGYCSCLCGQYKNISGMGQCHAFANLMADKVFGSYATKWTNEDGTDMGKNWKYNRSVNQYYAGDFIRIDGTDVGHTVFVTKVSGNTISVVDCNRDGPCRIDWDKTYTKSELDSRVIYVAHYDGNTLTGNGKTPPRLFVQYHVNGGTISPYTEYRIATTGLRFRENPSVGAAVLKNEIPNGTTISVLELKTQGGYIWAKAEHDGMVGWCAIYSQGDSEWYAARTGFYENDSMIYRHENATVHTQTLNYGEADDLYNCGTFHLERANHIFKGWSLSPDGGVLIDQDLAYKPEDLVPELENGDKTVTVYAVWEDITPSQITITYDANGGNGSISPRLAQKGDTIAVAKNAFSNKDNTFLGWTLCREDGKWLSQKNEWKNLEDLVEIGEERRLFSEDETLALKSPVVVTSGDHGYTFYANWKLDTIENIYLSSIEKQGFYEIGDYINTDEITLMVLYKDGTCRTVERSFVTSPVYLAEAGPRNIKVSYCGHETSFEVQVKDKREHRINGVASSGATGYLLPSTSAATIEEQGTWTDDELQVLCYENGFNLVFLPWGEAKLTEENRVLLYVPSGTVASDESIPGPKQCYVMNPTGEVNATIGVETRVYHRPDYGSKTVMVDNKNYTVIDTLQKGARVKVLFEMDGHYCIQTSSYTGFVEINSVVLDEDPRCIDVDAPVTDFCLEVEQGKTIDLTSLSVVAGYPSGFSKNVEDYEINLPSTEKVGEYYAVISYDEFKTFVKIKVMPPELTGIFVEVGPNKTVYKVGESIDLTGLTIRLEYSNGSYDIIRSGFEVDDVILDKIGNVTVKVRYGGFECDFTIEVIQSILKGDLDGDGVVGLEDAIYLLFHVNFPERYSTDQNVDYDKNGIVDLDDAIYFLFHVNFPQVYPLG